MTVCIIVRSDAPGASTGWIEVQGQRYRCALGRSGIVPGPGREGDGGTPAGDWPVRRLLYRSDKVSIPTLSLKTQSIQPDDGWCDDPKDANYNRPVKLPYPASHERLWREDDLYDLVLVLGHNDAPVVPGLGSAIFLHCARPDFEPTEGCVALAKPDLWAILSSHPLVSDQDMLSVRR